MVACNTPHHETIEKSNITYGEMLGVIVEASESKFRKRLVDVHNIETMNKPPADQRGQYMDEDEKPVTADDIDLKHLHEKEEEIRSMLQKHVRM